MSVLPWHEETWRRIEGQVMNDRLPHGLLVSGPADSGKDQLVDQLASFLLCQGDNPPCGQCSQCRLLEAGTHPDLLLVSPEDSRQIRVEQIRDLIEWAMQTAQQGGRKLCVIEPADRMNQQSANALLKVLEEPPADTIICLVTSQPSRLLPTLRSRCQKVECFLPAREIALNWLAEETGSSDVSLLLDIAGNNPLRAVRSIDDDYLALRREIATILSGELSPLQDAAVLAAHDPDRVLEIIYQLLAASIALTLTAGQVTSHQDLRQETGRLAETPLDDRYAMLERVSEARGLLAGTANPNVQMLLEWVLMTPGR